MAEEVALLSELTTLVVPPPVKESKQQKRKRKSLENQQRQAQIPEKKKPVLHDTATFDVHINERNAASAIWNPVDGLVEIVQMKGNFWKTTGFSVDRRCYLHPEEALLLYERGVISVEYEKVRIPYPKFYEAVVEKISLECHLAYVKLKSLDYLAFRHSNTNGTIHSLEGDADVFRWLHNNPGRSLLEATVSFDIYTHCFKWSKKIIQTTAPVARVVVL